ncbi:MAG: NAD-dependent epimerase/dehydratase family protein [Chitinispirillaceae bacterium]
MGRKILVTGGAGFIGSHLADELLEHGYGVKVLDNLNPQVHGEERRVPEYLDSKVEFIRGDVCNPEHVKEALEGVDAVFHFAAAVGVGQSMYQVQKYTRVNNLGTAVLMEQLIEKGIRKLIVASSMSIYGEGLYLDKAGSRVNRAERSLQQLKNGIWELADDQGADLRPIPTPESKQPFLASVYALSKYDQERMSLMLGRAYRIPTVALRFFNVYGSRQALSNPYTGVLAIFASRLLNNKSPHIFEDGNQRRDFVSVKDVVRGCRLVLESSAADSVFNIGSGTSYTVNDIASQVARALGKEDISPVVSGKYRVGDIRHCFSDITRAREVLGYEPRIDLAQGLSELTGWLKGQIAYDHLDKANAELKQRGLAV